MRLRPHPFVVRPLEDLSFDLVRGLHERTQRDGQNLFLAEGARFLSRAVEGRAVFAGMVLCPPRLVGSELRDLVTRLERAGVPRLRASPEEYAALSPGVSDEGESVAAGQGVLLVLRQQWDPLPKRVARDGLWLGLESVRTPGNLGTLMRSAEAAGATGLILFDRSEEGTPHGVDPHHPSAVRASMGSFFALRLVRTTHRAFRRWRREQGVAAYGAAGEAEMDYRRMNCRRPTVLMLGDERKGLSDGQRGSCDALVRIPMMGHPDSLNLAMAGTLMVYEAMNGRWPLTRSRSISDDG